MQFKIALEPDFRTGPERSPTFFSAIGGQLIGCKGLAFAVYIEPADAGRFSFRHWRGVQLAPQRIAI